MAAHVQPEVDIDMLGLEDLDPTALLAAVDSEAVDQLPLPAPQDMPPEETDVEFIAKLREISSGLPRGSVFQQARTVSIMSDFLDMHRTNEALKIFDCNRRECESNSLIPRVLDYLSIRVQRSKKIDRMTGLPLMHKQTGKPVYMAPSTLVHLSLDVRSMAEFIAVPPFTPLQSLQLEDAMNKHVEVLMTQFHLEPPNRDRLTLDLDSVRLLVDTVYDVHKDEPALALQMHCLILLFFYTGARGGSILKTGRYPLEYMVWRDILFIPKRDSDGNIIAIGVCVTLRHFKNFHRGVERLRIRFRISSVTAPKHLSLDLGCPLLAMAVSRGVFGPGKTLQDVLDENSDFLSFKCSEPYDYTPVLLARKSRLTLNPDQPLSYNKGNEWFQDILKASGMHTGENFANTLYSLRRGFATLIAANIDRRVARYFLGHHPDSRTLEKYYDQSAQDTNIVEGLLGEGQSLKLERISPAYTRDPPTGTIPLSILLARHPEYQQFKYKLDILTTSLKYGSSQWLKLEPWSNMAAKKRIAQSHLPVLVAVYTAKLRSIIRLAKNNYQNEALAKAQAERDAITYKEVEERRKAFQSDVDPTAEKLRRSLEEREVNLIQAVNRDDSTTEPQIEMSDDVELELDVENVLDSAIEAAQTDPSILRENNEAIEDDDLFAAEAADLAEAAGSDPESAETQPGAAHTTTASIPDNLGSADAVRAEERIQAVIASVTEFDDNGTTVDTAAPPATLLGCNAMAWLFDLVKLVGDSTSADTNDAANRRDPSSNHCQQCLDDPTTSSDDKGRLWNSSHHFALKRHQAQFHSAHSKGHRWLKAQQTDSKWVCPFDCDWSLAGAKPKWVRVRKHLIAHTRELKDLDSEVHYAVLPSTFAKAKKDHVNGLNEKDVKSAPSTKVYGARPTDYLLPGAFSALDLFDDKAAAVGLGLGLLGTQHLITDQTFLPSDIWAEVERG